MTEVFQRMSADYAQKHFPTGSVFESASKTLKRRGFAGIIFIGVWVAAALAGLVWGVGRTMAFMAEGEEDMLGVGIGICVFFALTALLFGVLLFFAVKSTRRNREDYIKLSAKKSRLSEHEIEEFDRQAMASDTYVLKLTAGLDRALSSAANKDGLLTRDYVYLAGPAQIVLRVKDLKACCFNDYTYYISTGKRSKKIHCLAVTLISSNGVTDSSDVTEEAGRALMALLRERNSAIDTNGGKVLPEGALDAYKKKVLEG